MKTTLRRSGFTLIEMLCVMALLVLLGFGLAVLFREVFLVQRSQSQGFDKVLQTSTLADQFRRDVAQAQAAPAEWQDIKADANTLILEPKTGDRIVYRWHAGELHRLTFTERKPFTPSPVNAAAVGIALAPVAGNPPATDRTLPTVGPHIGVEFVRAANVIRLRLHTLKAGQPVPGQSLEITAALAGDWR
jgi:prepilin-type N-terminal cleavage/methylation domain-containing protein